MVVATNRPLPFDEAIADYRKRGGNVFESDRWTDVNAQQDRVGFRVVRSAGYNILADVNAALDKAQAEGRTPEAFLKGLVPLLKQKAGGLLSHEGRHHKDASLRAAEEVA